MYHRSNRSCKVSPPRIVKHQRILITGGSGFIGSHLAERLLNSGIAVGILDNFDSFYSEQVKRTNISRILAQVAVYEEDIRNGEACSKVLREGWDAIVHLAAKAGVRPSIAEPHAYLQTNVLGTLNLLEAARIQNIGRFVFASSSSVYGGQTTLPYKESNAVHRTLSPYAATKLAGEQICSVYAHLHSIHTTALRFFTVYGPRQRPDLAIHSFTHALYNGLPITQFGDGSSRRDYTFIDDIIDGMMAAMQLPNGGFEVLNLGGSKTTALSDLIQILERLTGKSAILHYLPAQPGDMLATHADTSKAERLLGFKPRVDMETGLREFVSWYAKGNGHEVAF